MSSIFETRKRPELGIDNIIVIDCGAGGRFECSSTKEANEVIEQANMKGCGFSISVEDLPERSLMEQKIAALDLAKQRMLDAEVELALASEEYFEELNRKKQK